MTAAVDCASSTITAVDGSVSLHVGSWLFETVDEAPPLVSGGAISASPVEQASLKTLCISALSADCAMRCTTAWRRLNSSHIQVLHAFP